MTVDKTLRCALAACAALMLAFPCLAANDRSCDESPAASQAVGPDGLPSVATILKAAACAQKQNARQVPVPSAVGAPVAAASNNGGAASPAVAPKVDAKTDHGAYLIAVLGLSPRSAASGERCSSDKECGDDFCINGRCDRDGDRCHSNSDCGGDYCVNGRCDRPSGNNQGGDRCRSNSDCGGDYCVDGRCERPSGGDQSGDRCRSNSECHGHYCVDGRCQS